MQHAGFINIAVITLTFIPGGHATSRYLGKDVNVFTCTATFLSTAHCNMLHLARPCISGISGISCINVAALALTLKLQH